MKWTVKRVDEMLRGIRNRHEVKDAEWMDRETWRVGQRVRIVGFGMAARSYYDALVDEDGYDIEPDAPYHEPPRVGRAVVWQPYAVVTRVTLRQVTVRACSENWVVMEDAIDQYYCPTAGGHRIRRNNARTEEDHIDPWTWIEKV